MNKKLLRLGAAAALLTAFVIISSCTDLNGPSTSSRPGTKGGQVNELNVPLISEVDRLFIPPRTLTGTQESDLKNILSRYDASIYKIHLYHSQTPPQPLGALPSDDLSTGVIAFVDAYSQSVNLNGVSVQAGRGRGGSTDSHSKDKALVKEILNLFGEN